jgi:hypothetical protein
MLISKMLGATMVVGAPDPLPLASQARPTAGRSDCNAGREQLSPHWNMLDRDRVRGYISRHLPRANS